MEEDGEGVSLRGEGGGDGEGGVASAEDEVGASDCVDKQGEGGDCDSIGAQDGGGDSDAGWRQGGDEVWCGDNILGAQDRERGGVDIES